jgi:hypothetical protein
MEGCPGQKDRKNIRKTRENDGNSATRKEKIDKDMWSPFSNW